MTWLTFITWLICLYSFYYALNVLFDLSNNRSGNLDAEDIHEISFMDREPAKSIDYVTEEMALTEPEQEPASTGLGGVSLSNLFHLAKIEAIDYTKKVSF